MELNHNAGKMELNHDAGITILQNSPLKWDILPVAH